MNLPMFSVQLDVIRLVYNIHATTVQTNRPRPECADRHISSKWIDVKTGAVSTSDLLLTFLDWPAIRSLQHNFLNAGSHVTPGTSPRW